MDPGPLLRRAIAAIGDAPFALIGGQALLSHGGARQTMDIDLLTCARDVLRSERWSDEEPAVDIRWPSTVDALDGVAELAFEEEEDGPAPGAPPPVEVIVLDRPWARAILDRATGRVELGGVRLPVVDLPDLAILKAYADGPRDRSDIASLAERADWPEIQRVVEERLAAAGPPAAARAWARLMRLLDA